MGSAAALDLRRDPWHPAMVVTRGPALAERMSDEELVAALRSGERWPADALLGRYLRMMNGLAYRLVGPGDLEDVVQESVAQALRGMRRLRHGAALSTWFGRIVVLVARKAVRRRRLLARLGFVDAGAVDWEGLVAPSAPPDVVAELRAVYRAVERLPARPRQALILRRVEGRALDEIAALMDASLASVKRWVAAGEAALAPDPAEEPR